VSIAEWLALIGTLTGAVWMLGRLVGRFETAVDHLTKQVAKLDATLGSFRDSVEEEHAKLWKAVGQPRAPAPARSQPQSS